MAFVGHASAQSAQPGGLLDESTTGLPRNRSGSAGSRAGYGIVRCPCLRRARDICSMAAPYKSCPQYDKLKLLLHSGKSEICWFRIAIATPAQLWNDGST